MSSPVILILISFRYALGESVPHPETSTKPDEDLVGRMSEVELSIDAKDISWRRLPY